jgi:hypothetical protein
VGKGTDPTASDTIPDILTTIIPTGIIVGYTGILTPIVGAIPNAPGNGEVTQPSGSSASAWRCSASSSR